MRLGVPLALRCLATRLLAMGGVLLAASLAQAIPISLQIYADGVLIGDVDETHLGCVDVQPGFSAQCQADNLVYTGDYPALEITSLDFTIERNPTVTGTLNVTNLQNFTQRFTMVFNLPIDPINNDLLIGGSVSGTVSDSLGDDATVSAPAGEAIYTARIDGVDVQELHEDPASFTAFFFDTATIAQDIFGNPIPSLFQLGPAFNSIELELDFFLTGNDSATFDSEFVVEAVPEPSTGALVALGLLLLAKRRRL